MTLDEFQSSKLQNLQKVLCAVYQDNLFYQEKFTQSSFKPQINSIEDFKECPFTTKSELQFDQQQYPPYGRLFPRTTHESTRFHQTSGSTGEPLIWLDTPSSWNDIVHNWKQVLVHAKITAQDIFFFPFSFGPFLGFWAGFDAAIAHGCLTIPGGALSSLDRLKMMHKVKATCMACTPTYALRLAEVARESRISLPPIRKMIVAGEPGGSLPEIRKRLEKEWAQVEIYDHHGMTEVGPVTYQKLNDPWTLWLMTNAFYAEVIDEKGKAVTSGETGELVLTSLNRLDAPLIRYKTGDLVRPEIKEQEKDLALNGGLLGRCDDMVVCRGVNIYPSALEQVVFSQNEVAEYRVTLEEDRGMLDLKLDVEWKKSSKPIPTLENELKSKLKSQLQLSVPIQSVEAGFLPRFDLKARRWIKPAT